MKGVSCIVPAFNEGPRIGNVLKVLCKTPSINEVIVVNDASTDNTLSAINKFKHNKVLKIINLRENKGKSFSVACGIEKAKYDIILMIDSDLKGLTSEHINRLVDPVLKGNVDFTISLRENSLWIYKLLGIDFVSGERAIKRKLLGNLHEIKKLDSFGLEVFVNNKLIKNRNKIKVIYLNGVSHARKSEKIGFYSGFIGEIGMIFQLIKTQGLGMVLQIAKMKKLMVNDSE
jgi:glycosyltransferase involved in cell wall biosynthesis